MSDFSFLSVVSHLNCFVFVIILVWKTVHSSAITQIKANFTLSWNFSPQGHFPPGGFPSRSDIFCCLRSIGGEWASKDKRKHHSARKIPLSGKQSWDRQDRTLLALSFSTGKQSCHEWKTKKFMQRCLQSTWRELGVAYVEFLRDADCEISWNQLAFSKTRNLNNFKTNHANNSCETLWGRWLGDSKPAKLKIYI